MNDEIDTLHLMSLIKQIFECVENDKGESPFLTVYSDEILVIEFPQDKRFRIEIKDLTRFQ